MSANAENPNKNPKLYLTLEPLASHEFSSDFHWHSHWTSSYFCPKWWPRIATTCSPYSKDVFLDLSFDLGFGKGTADLDVFS